MDVNISELEQNISKLSNTELVEMLTEKADEYTPEALQAAEEEIKKRGGYETVKGKSKLDKLADAIEDNLPMLKAEKMIERRIGSAFGAGDKMCVQCGAAFQTGFQHEWVGARTSIIEGWSHIPGKKTYTKFTSVIISVCPGCAKKEDKRDWIISGIFILPFFMKAFSRLFKTESEDSKSVIFTRNATEKKMKELELDEYWTKKGAGWNTPLFIPIPKSKNGGGVNG